MRGLWGSEIIGWLVVMRRIDGAVMTFALVGAHDDGDAVLCCSLLTGTGEGCESHARGAVGEQWCQSRSATIVSNAVDTTRSIGTHSPHQQHKRTDWAALSASNARS